MTGRVGTFFLHSRVLSARAFDGETLQPYKITRIAQGTVYYRAAYRHSDRVQLGAPACCSVLEFPRYCAKIITEAEII